MGKIVCVFAHPDDEAFAAGGAIAKLSQENEVYVLCATKGEAGVSGDLSKKELGEVRARELEESARILGVKAVHFLGFEDGTLCNNMYAELAAKITEHVEKIAPDTLVTMDFHGNSGHMDHIMVAYVSRYVFEKMSTVTTFMQFCAKYEYSKQMKDYFIYFPKGYTEDEVDLVIDIEDVWETKVKAMYAHKSQLHDVEKILSLSHNIPKKDYFLVTKKD